MLLFAAGAVGGTGCRGEIGPSLGLELRDLPPPPLPSAEDEPGDDAGERAAEPERDLFFSTGPGRRAIFARERQDHVTAIEELDRLLARPGLDGDTRGVAELLRGLEDDGAGRYVQAATRYAAARSAPVLRPLEVWLTLQEAQARLHGGDPQTARSRLASLDGNDVQQSPFRGDVMVALADAQSRTQSPDDAIAGYEAYLARFPDGRRHFEVQAKLAHLLSQQAESPRKERALELYEALLLDSPFSDYAIEAAKEIPGLRSALGALRSAARVREFERKLALARVEEALERRRYKTAIDEAAVLLKDGSLAPLERCRVLYAQGSAVFKQRKRAESRPIFERAGTACKAVKGEGVDYEVKSRYQAGRGLYAEGRHAVAARAFETLAAEHAKHSYADDAWVLAGESWEQVPDLGKAKIAYRKAVDAGGDKEEEARRRLLLLLFAAEDAAGALALCDEALATRIPHPAVEAKFQYFRAKALARLGRLEDATSGWLETIRTDPLGYPALQALNRLREADALVQGLVVLRAPPPLPSDRPTVPGETGARARALLFARLGLGREAGQELAFAGISGWPAAEVLDQAGLYAEGQRIVATMGSGWRRHPPQEGNRRHWQLAHPRPFQDVVEAQQRRHRVPSLLAYAVMQTESRFDPGVTSWAGARGLIQLMPATAKTVAQGAGLNLDAEALYRPETNLDLGLRYLSGLVARFGGGDAAVPLAVPGYNAGPGAVSRWLKDRGDWDLDLFIEAIPYDETRHYTQSVLGRWWAYRWIYGGDETAIPELPMSVRAATVQPSAAG